MDSTLTPILDNIKSNLPPELLSVLYSGNIGRLVEGLTISLGLNPVQSAQLNNQIHMLFMLLTRLQDLDNFLDSGLNLDESQKETVWAAIDSGLFTEEIYSILIALDEMVLPVSNQSLQSEIAETEASLGQLNNIRTMQTDAEPIYTTTQNAILDESRRASVATPPIPPPQPATNPNLPRWSSDQ